MPPRSLSQLLALAAVVASASAAAYTQDWRYINNGRLMYSTGYMDQPYCVVDIQHKSNSSLSRWVCTVTLNDASEGSAGEHIAAFYSDDQGVSWTGPIVVNPDFVAAKLDNSYSNTIQAYNGRIYTIFGVNLHNVTQLPNGKPLPRTDELGVFAMRWSDDGGATWSTNMTVLPYRTTAIDRSNDYAGKVNLFWNVDQFKIRNDTAYFMFTKITHYPQNPPEEGYMIASPNILTADDPAEVTWQMLPNTDHGPGAPPQASVASTVAEEWHVLPLMNHPGYFAVYRTSLGTLGAAYTNDSTGASGWVVSEYAQFDASPLPGRPANATLSLKNPRGPITLKRFSNGYHLMLWYNNFCNSFTGVGDRSSRNPYWLSAAREVHPGVLTFSQPEIVIYGVASSDQRPGYPDFIEDVDFSIWISETQKTATHFHRLPPEFLTMLWSQFTINQTVTSNLVANVSKPAAGQSVTLPANAFANLSATVTNGWPGFTLDFWLGNHGAAKPGQLLFNTSKRDSGHIAVQVGPKMNVTLTMSDDTVAFNVSTDDACTAALQDSHQSAHYVAFVVDGGSALGMTFVDGKLCDGSLQDYWGYNEIDRGFTQPGASTSGMLAATYGGTILRARIYNRALFTTELVGNWRQGPLI